MASGQVKLGVEIIGASRIVDRPRQDCIGFFMSDNAG